MLAPCGLLVIGAAIGYAFSLDQAVALERLLGLLVASLLAVFAYYGLRQVARCAPVLLGASVVALVVSVWVVAASGPEVFRGTLGSLLDVVFRPVFGVVHLTDDVS